MEEQELYLQQIADLLYKAIQQQLRIKYRSQGYFGGFKRGNSPRIASGQMLNSLSVDVLQDFQTGDPIIVAAFNTNPEFLPEIIDQGRKPSFKYPPLDEIEKWIKIKPVYWRNERGRFTRASMNTKRFLIARSIKEKGYKGINFFEKAQAQVMDELVLLGEEAAASYFQSLIDQQLVQMI